ncbi:hypothetical protein, partial [Brevibacterium paucivorans]
SVFRAAQTTPLATLAPERTWYVNGFSKSLSPGLRVGTLVSPENNQLQGRAVLQATTLGVSHEPSTATVDSSASSDFPNREEIRGCVAHSAFSLTSSELEVLA